MRKNRYDQEAHKKVLHNIKHQRDANQHIKLYHLRPQNLANVKKNNQYWSGYGRTGTFI